jgi:hypothetical protein
MWHTQPAMLQHPWIGISELHIRRTFWILDWILCCDCRMSFDTLITTADSSKQARALDTHSRVLSMAGGGVWNDRLQPLVLRCRMDFR